VFLGTAGAFARWQTDGTWARVEAALRTQVDAAGELDWDAALWVWSAAAGGGRRLRLAVIQRPLGADGRRQDAVLFPLSPLQLLDLQPVDLRARLVT